MAHHWGHKRLTPDLTRICLYGKKTTKLGNIQRIGRKDERKLDNEIKIKSTLKRDVKATNSVELPNRTPTLLAI